MTEQRSPATFDELEERWSVTKGHLYKMKADGRLRTFNVGKYLRVPWAEVERIENGAKVDGC